MNNTFHKKTKILTSTVAALVISSQLGISEDSQPKLFEPYAPKPSGKAPDGWEIKILEGSQVENSTTLDNKKEIKVTVPAYELVPKQSSTSIVFKDPGFEPELSTSQKSTIGAVLTDYSEQAGELQSRLEKVIQELEKGLGEIAKNETVYKKPETAVKKTDKPTDKKQTDEKKKSNSSAR
jgi:hypothetical protein